MISPELSTSTTIIFKYANFLFCLRKMRKIVFVILVCVFLMSLISIASAEIMISQPKALYNIGESFDATVSVSKGGEPLTANIVCSGTEKLVLFKNLGSEEKTIQISQPLTKSFLGDMQGICSLEVEYGAESAASQEFKITSAIEITLNIANLNYNAGDSVLVTGEAKKENSKPVEGFVEISLENTNIKLLDTVKAGKFSTNFTLPENIGSGRYNLKAAVYEKDDKGGVSNQGEESAVIGVKQEPKKLEVAIAKQSVVPGEELSFRVILYDQANYEMPGDVSVVVRDNNEEEILKKLAKTDEDIPLKIAEDASPGYWKIEASSFGIQATRVFSVEENEKAKFEIINDTLVITNIGNILYDKAVQIAIGSEVEIKELLLDVGESKTFRLLAPDGDYSITITDGSTTLTESGIALTGNIIGVQDLKDSLSIWGKYPIVWLFLIMVAGLFILMLVQRTIKRKSYAYPSSEPLKSKKGVIGALGERFRRMPTALMSSEKQLRADSNAEHTLLPGGTKQNVALIALKIKNQISKEARHSLEMIFREAYAHAIPYDSQDFIFLIFSPLVTKTFKNYVPAVKTATGILKSVRENNKRFRDKISFGISVHCGEIVNKIEEGRLKFTSLGTILTKAKKLADLSDGEVLLSKEIHEKTISEIKASQQIIRGIEVYKVKQIIDAQKNQQFIKEFMTRINEEGKERK